MHAAESMADALALRPITTDDRVFLEEVYASTRADELALTDWSAEKRAEFCRMQFAAQHEYYQSYYAGATFDVIVHNGAPAGRLYVARWKSEIRIIDIALLPKHRRAGIGSHLLRQLQEEARAAGKSLSIHVEKFNPAKSLYQRLGFAEVEDKGVYLLMEWRG